MHKTDDFIEHVCKECGLCPQHTVKMEGPGLCYRIYQDNPTAFYREIYKKLLLLHKWPSTKKRSMKLFRSIICKACPTGGTSTKIKRCQKTNVCKWAFNPAAATLVSVTSRRKKEKNIWKGEFRKKPKGAPPVFFCSPNADWEASIREAIDDNNDSEKQDHTKPAERATNQNNN